jgi:hypothetical protein
MMRRILLLATVALVMATMMVAPSSAVAAPGDQAVCTGEFGRANAGPSFGPLVASFAGLGGIGVILGPSSASDDCSAFPTP